MAPFLIEDSESKKGFLIEVNALTSFATISCPARITKIHPEVLEFSTPFPVRNYALCCLSSPVLKKVKLDEIWIKIVDINPAKELQDAAFQWGNTGLLMLNKEHALAQLLEMQLKTHWKKYLPPPPMVAAKIFAAIPASAGISAAIPQSTGISHFDRQKALYLLLFLLVNLGILYLLTVFVPKFAKNREKSGKQFSEQLLHFQGRDSP